MKKTLVTAVAFSLLAPAFAAPALAEGRKVGHQPKVCLVTFGADTGNTQADADVIKAQYVPLPIAMKLEARNDALSDIYTYGPGRYTGPEVDFNYDGDSTEDTCAYLADLAESNDD